MKTTDEQRCFESIWQCFPYLIQQLHQLVTIYDWTVRWIEAVGQVSWCSMWLRDWPVLPVYCVVDGLEWSPIILACARHHLPSIVAKCCSIDYDCCHPSGIFIITGSLAHEVPLTWILSYLGYSSWKDRDWSRSFWTLLKNSRGYHWSECHPIWMLSLWAIILRGDH